MRDGLSDIKSWKNSTSHAAAWDTKAQKAKVNLPSPCRSISILRPC